MPSEEHQIGKHQEPPLVPILDSFILRILVNTSDVTVFMLVQLVKSFRVFPARFGALVVIPVSNFKESKEGITDS